MIASLHMRLNSVFCPTPTLILFILFFFFSEEVIFYVGVKILLLVTHSQPIELGHRLEPNQIRFLKS